MKLGEAFSLRRNAAGLFRTAKGHDAALDGIRAIAILWVVACHSIWSRGLGKLPREVYREMMESKDPVLRTLLRGDLGVNLFFTLSGFLIGTILIKELRATGSLALGRFYWRRYLRLTPVYAAVVGIFCAIPKFPNRGAAWANLLYVNNFVPETAKRFMGWTWSLAVEEQFYLAMPLVLIALHRRARLVLGLVALTLVGLAVRVLVVEWFQLTLPIPPLLGDPRWLVLGDELYIKPYTCFACFLPGVVAAHLRLAVPPDRLRAGLAAITWWAFPLSIAVPALVAYAPTVDPSARWSVWASTTYLAGHAIAFAVCVAYLILVAVLDVGPGAYLNRLLSLRVFCPIAQLSYSVYLVHQVLIWMMYIRFKPGPARSLFDHFPWIAGAACASLVLACLLYLLIERPIMNLRPAPKATPSPAP